MIISILVTTMKCMASRIGSVETDADDVNDILFLIQHLDLKKAGDVMELVSAYCPPGRIPIKKISRRRAFRGGKI